MSLRESIQASLGPAFAIERDLDRPGTSAAFVVRDSEVGREVVVEVLSADLAGVVDLTRFKREINFAGRLEDPNIVPLLSAGAADGVPYVVSSFIQGEWLRARMAGGTVPSDEVLRILRDVASALAHGHERGVLHRDLRLDDVVLRDGTAMVARFGVARAVYAAGGPGDPTIDNRSDIGAFGALGYELLTGHPPVGDPPEPIQKYRPSPPTGLAPLIMRCLSKNAAERPETASEIVRALDEIISPSDGIFASLWPVESSTLVARSDYYKSRGQIAVVVVALAMCVAGYFAWRSSSPSSPGAAATVPAKTIAVLPLANVGGDSATLYFTQGLTEELRATLRHIPGAFVVSGGATDAAVSTDSGAIKAVGDRLHVGAIVVGQLRRSRDSVHLSVQLRNVSDTAVLWKSTYDKPAADLFQLEDDVARAIAKALHVDIPAERVLATRATANAKAHDFNLQGEFLEYRHTDLEISQALGMFQQALQQDPKYVTAWAGVAQCWARLADDFVAPKEAVPHLRDAVAHGLALDPTNAALGFMHGRIAYLYDRDAHAAQGYMLAAVAADSALPDALEWLPQVLWTNGASDSARAFVRRAVDRDSISPATLLNAWRYAKVAGNALDALEFCSRLEALHAGTLCDALQQLDIGRGDQAVDIFQKQAADAGPRGVDAQLGYATVLVAAGRTADARKVVAQVDHETAVPGRYMREDEIALMHGLIGDSTGALRWYDKALAAGSAGIGALYWRTAANPLRKTPQLLDFAKRAGLARLHRRTGLDFHSAHSPQPSFVGASQYLSIVTPPRNARRDTQPHWKTLLDGARREMAPSPQQQRDTEIRPAWPADRRLVYVVDVPATTHASGLVLELATEKRTVSGGWEPPVQFRLGADVWLAVPDPVDRQIAQMLLGALPPTSHDRRDRDDRTSGFVLRESALETTLRLICDTGRCHVRMTHADRPVYPVRWDDGPPWRLRLRIAPQRTNCYSVTALLERAGQEMPLSEPAILHSEGFLLARGVLGRFDHSGAYPLVTLFRHQSAIVIGESELPALLESLYAVPRLPPIEFPPDTGLTEVHAAPLPSLTIFPDPNPGRGTHHRLEPGFIYGKTRISGQESSDSVFDRDAVAIRYRDFTFEAEARDRLVDLGAREEWVQGAAERCLTIAQGRLGEMIAELVRGGWRVDADGAAYRSAGATRAMVRSGIDWFELDAGVTYGDVEVPLHDLLEARRAGETTIMLADGTVGLLPLEWLARLGPLAASGTGVGDTIRYSLSQMVLLDALLDTLPDADVDATFEKARAELHSFDRIEPADPVEGFEGTLREYQREGLGWLHFLRRFELGGCLADDMGLGKTVQVLALLDSRRALAAELPVEERRPSIVIVPRSLVFNWIREAERFTPRLRLLDYSGVGRNIQAIDPASVDLVITTYGTLRRDAAALSAIRFDYAVLDEAQAIKNAGSASAKAARLIKADHRLAMTGTPIENRLEELWSLFEFLNPGMLGRSSAFSKLVRLADGDSGTGSRQLLAGALRPVILRRTKDQVAQDLPARVEQTLTVELEGAQRKFYDALLNDYRSSVLDRVDRVGIGKARMHILEALLRLRQAACHPVLADPRKVSAPSAKLDALIPTLEEVIAEGHKALVFSQFTTFLALVRVRLDAAGIPYEYLDGRVRNRQARVDRFQNDPTCPLFLVSLKAGGQGLNLTAADYVYILDPWWNPAVEAQAIDRAHRIGQTRHVMATRLVARDTIEEKILELQASKRALADAILGQDQGVLSQIGRAELEMLLR